MTKKRFIKGNKSLDSFIIKKKKDEKVNIAISKERDTPEEENILDDLPKTEDVTKGDHNLKKQHDYYLMSTTYDAQKNRVAIKLLDPEIGKIIYFYDPYGFEPYCYSKLPIEKIKSMNFSPMIVSSITNDKKIDLLRLKEINLTKIVTKTPSDVPTVRNKLGQSWEANIRFHLNWLYDYQLVPGRKYWWDDEKKFINPKSESTGMTIPNEVINLVQKYGDMITVFEPDFQQEIPDIPIIACDIEIDATEGQIPQATNPKSSVICVGLVSNDGMKKALLLERPSTSAGSKPEDFPQDLLIERFSDEKELLERTFEILLDYPMIVSFNGDRFDFPYLHERAKRLKVNSPILWNRRRNTCDFRNSIHIDLYRFYHNVAIRTYAFGGKYNEENLNAIAESLLGIGKIKLDNEINKVDEYNLVYYCYQDTQITLDLLLFDNKTPLTLIFILSRVCRTPIDELIRSSVSNWVRNLFYFEHRRKNYLIPNQEDIQRLKGRKAESQAIIKEKKFLGAKVISPVPGIHFNVAVLDFASLYPSIIGTFNLSYETINCHHEECKSNKIPQTSYWVCSKVKGVMSTLIGFIKDIRVLWLKPASKDDSPKREFFKIFERSLKVIINASYGVFGSSSFQFYCIAVAESTTAFGRDSIEKTIKKAQSMGLKVLYGDTDSVFLLNPSNEQIQEIINWSHKELGVGLEVDKEYRYCVLSERKKNYLGVFHDSSVDIKGLMGKKRNTPPFLQKEFQQVIKILAQVNSENEFEAAREKIRKRIRNIYLKLERNAYSPEDLAITVQLSKDISQYKVKPPHVKAALMLQEKLNRRVVKGQLIRYIKIKHTPGILPLELMTENVKIDVKAYKANVSSIFDQLLETLDINADEVASGQVNLKNFFG